MEESGRARWGMERKALHAPSPPLKGFLGYRKRELAMEKRARSATLLLLFRPRRTHLIFEWTPLAGAKYIESAVVSSFYDSTEPLGRSEAKAKPTTTKEEGEEKPEPALYKIVKMVA